MEPLLRGFSTHFSSSARQDLHFEGQLDGFIPSRLDFEGPNFTRKIDIFKTLTRNISKTTIPETVLNAIF